MELNQKYIISSDNNIQVITPPTITTSPINQPSPIIINIIEVADSYVRIGVDPNQENLSEVKYLEFKFQRQLTSEVTSYIHSDIANVDDIFICLPFHRGESYNMNIRTKNLNAGFSEPTRLFSFTTKNTITPPGKVKRLNFENNTVSWIPPKRLCNFTSLIYQVRGEKRLKLRLFYIS